MDIEKMKKEPKEKFSIETGEMPMDGCLCIFYFKEAPDYSLNGSLVFNEDLKIWEVMQLSNNQMFPVKIFDHYKHVYNDNGGFYFHKNNK